MFRAVLQTMRPHQWVKNTFVLAPLVFSQNLTSVPHLVRAFTATGLFCLLSGAVYLINDLVDRHRDLHHPTKRHRPIPSGRLSESAARAWAIGAVGCGLAAALALEPRLAMVLAVYFGLNLAYSLQLKHVVFIDVTVIATGFLLRVLGGAFAIDVPISLWLIVCTLTLSLFLGLGKRKHELVAVESGGVRTRRVLDNYRLKHVKLAMAIAAGTTLAAYTAYTLDETTRAQFGTDWLTITVPFIVLGLWRFYRLTERVDHPESPTEQMIRDGIFLANVGAWCVAVLALIYL